MKHLPTVPALRPIANTMPRLEHRAVDSSHVKSVGYDATQGHLQVTFKDGSSYDYPGVPPMIYDQFINSKSKGAFMREVLRTRFRSIKRSGTHLKGKPSPGIAGVGEGVPWVEPPTFSRLLYSASGD